MATSLNSLSASVLVHGQPDDAATASRGLAHIVAWLSAKLDWHGHMAKNGEVGRFLDANGGVLTDELEREISRKFGRIVG